MNTFLIAKVAVHIVSAAGVTKVLTQIIRNNTTIVTTTDKVLVNSGGFVLGSMISAAAKDHVSHMINEVVEQFKESKGEVEAQKAGTPEKKKTT